MKERLAPATCALGPKGFKELNEHRIARLSEVVAHALFMIAARARKGEVSRIIRSPMSTRKHMLNRGTGSTVFQHDKLGLAMNAFSNKTAHAFVSNEGSVRGDHGQHEFLAGGHGVRYVSKPRATRFA
jgi:hypothetical protein